jgi:hypothetical protein
MLFYISFALELVNILLMFLKHFLFIYGMMSHSPVEVFYLPNDPPFPPVEKLYPPIKALYPPVEQLYLPIDPPFPPVKALYPPVEQPFRQLSNPIRQ